MKNMPDNTYYEVRFIIYMYGHGYQTCIEKFAALDLAVKFKNKISKLTKDYLSSRSHTFASKYA